MSYILDADWAIEALAERTRARGILRDLAPQGVALSIITLGEIYEGAYRSSNPQAYLDIFNQFIQPFSLLNPNQSIMLRFAEIRALLRRRGELITDFDIVLGATALH